MWFNYSIVGLYTFLVVMATWSLFAAKFTDPGRIKPGYRYDKLKLTPTAQALLDFVDQNRDQENQRSFTCVLPLDLGQSAPMPVPTGGQEASVLQ